MSGFQTCNRREFIRLTAGLAATTFGTLACDISQAPSSGSRNKPPNVLFVFADQMRFSAMGCMGNGLVRTPNLDDLANQGILFTNAFSSSPACSPYRAQLMTGKYSHKNGVIHNGLKLPEDEVCIAEIFKAAGYSTGYIGKWHLEGTAHVPEDDIRRHGFVPPGRARQGWDYWAAIDIPRNYFRPRYFRDTPELIIEEGYQPDVYTDLAIEYIRRHREQSFCLMVSLVPPHNTGNPRRPYMPPKKFDIYKPEDVPLRPNVPTMYAKDVRTHLAGYYGLVTSLDYNIGRLIQALNEAGIAEDTIFCFSSDHGDMIGSQGHIQKQRPWEESIHVPFIMSYPRGIRASQKKDVLFNSVDIMPTLLGLCDVQVPKGVQGTDLSDTIVSETDKGPDSAYFAIKSRVAGPGWDWRGVRTKEWMFATTPTRDWVFYNVEEDPYELENLVNDVRYANEKRRLQRLLREWIDHTGDTFPLPS